MPIPAPIYETIARSPRLHDLCKRGWRRARTTPVSQALDAFSRSRGRRVAFVQVGANDGLRNDPLREFIVRDAWAGLLVEPLPQPFAQLQRNYRYLRGRRTLRFVQAAVTGAHGGTLHLWVPSHSYLARQSPARRRMLLRLASTERAKLLAHVPDADALTAMTVPAEPINQLLVDQPAPPDLLAIDAEGHEATILPALDLVRHPVPLILYESEHLQGADAEAVTAHLRRHGYTLLPAGRDTVALRDAALAATLEAAFIKR